MMCHVCAQTPCHANCPNADDGDWLLDKAAELAQWRIDGWDDHFSTWLAKQPEWKALQDAYIEHCLDDKRCLDEAYDELTNDARAEG